MFKLLNIKMDIPSGEWFFTFANVVITSKSKEQSHHNCREILKAQKFIYDEQEWMEDNDSQIVAVYGDFFNKNLHRFNVFKNASIFLVHNSDEVPNEESVLKWLDNNPNIILYCQNLTFEHTRAFVLPIGQANSMWKHGNKDVWKRSLNPDKSILVSMTYCEKTNPLRNNLDVSSKRFITTLPKLNYAEYVNALSLSKYVICPPGNGPDTHRLWETLAAGAIPIVINTPFIIQLKRSFPDIPLVILDDYNSLNINLLNNDSFVPVKCLTKSYWNDLFKIYKKESRNCIVLMTDKNYIHKCIKTIYDIKSIGGYKGTIIILPSPDVPDSAFDGIPNILIKRFDLIDIEYLLSKLKEKPFVKPNDGRHLNKTFQWHKIHLFDEYFNQWKYVFYIDAGMTIFKDINIFFELAKENTLLAHSDNYPTYEWDLSSQFDTNYPDKYQELHKRINLHRDGFQTTIMLYDTNIIEKTTKQELIKIMNEYPICRTNEQALFNIYFNGIYHLWRPINTSYKGKLLYDYIKRWNYMIYDYTMLKQP
jgi:hypothetical protein